MNLRQSLKLPFPTRRNEGIDYEEKRNPDPAVCLHPRRGPDVSGLYEAGTLAHHHVLPVYYRRQRHGAGCAGSRLHRGVYVQLFRYLQPPRPDHRGECPGRRLSGAHQLERQADAGLHDGQPQAAGLGPHCPGRPGGLRERHHAGVRRCDVALGPEQPCVPRLLSDAG